MCARWKSTNVIFDQLRIIYICHVRKEYRILIISTVYWAKMVAFYIENNKSLMNVAVARVKDFFFVFGSRICCFIPNQA